MPKSKSRKKGGRKPSHSHTWISVLKPGGRTSHWVCKSCPETSTTDPRHRGHPGWLAGLDWMSGLG